MINPKYALIKLLKASKRQFYDEEGKECTVEEYVNILLRQPKSDVLAYQKRLKTLKDDKIKRKNN